MNSNFDMIPCGVRVIAHTPMKTVLVWEDLRLFCLDDYMMLFLFEQRHREWDQADGVDWVYLGLMCLSQLSNLLSFLFNVFSART